MRRAAFLGILLLLAGACLDDDDASDDDDGSTDEPVVFLFGDGRDSPPGSLDYDIWRYDDGVESLVVALPFAQEHPTQGIDSRIWFTQQVAGVGSEVHSYDEDNGDVVRHTTDAGEGAFVANRHPEVDPEDGSVWFTSIRADGTSVIRRLDPDTGDLTTPIDLGAGTIAAAPRISRGDGTGQALVHFTAQTGGDWGVWSWTAAAGASAIAGTDTDGIYDAAPVLLEDDVVVWIRDDGEARGEDDCTSGLGAFDPLAGGGVLTPDDLEPLADHLDARGTSRPNHATLHGDGVVSGLDIAPAPGGPPVADGVPIELVGLHLQSVAPIRIRPSSMGGTPPPDWDVSVDLSDPFVGQPLRIDVTTPDGAVVDPVFFDLFLGDGTQFSTTVPGVTWTYEADGEVQPSIVVHDACGRLRPIFGPVVTVLPCDVPECVDLDGDGFASADDLDDNDPNTFPGAPELCDGIDNDGDGDTTDEDADEDGDGHTPCDGDCDDTNPLTFEGAPEICDGIDNNCDGLNDADEGLCPDLDGDGIIDAIDDDADGDGVTGADGDCDDLDPLVGLSADDLDGDGIPDCIDPDADGDGFTVPPPGYGGGDPAGDGYDFDDGDGDSYPGAPEICDGVDNDGDGVVPDDELDDDGDGVAICAGDCDDSDPSRFPGALELCNGIDDDCDAVVPADELDADGDGFIACDECDDNDATSFPAAPELCDGLDNDCDGALPGDELDGDGDGFIACDECDDGEPAVFPGAAEACNFVDDDCDTLVDEDFDVDLDGFTTCGGDCDDTTDAAYPGALEQPSHAGTCGDGLDNDCDGDADCNDGLCYNYVGCVPDGPPGDTTITGNVTFDDVLCFGLQDVYTGCIEDGGTAVIDVLYFSDAARTVNVGADQGSFAAPADTVLTWAYTLTNNAFDTCIWTTITTAIAGGC